ncbi:protein artichoke-like [Lytechinus pictus]|uniref:protein artichoke-like n=1 Tax=Lytechinus pictus TaxID=7653 RepID=UPI0030BA1C3A
MYLLFYVLFLFGRTHCWQCLNLCACEQKGHVVNVECTESNLEDIPMDLPCNVGKLDVSRNFITTLKRGSFSCNGEMVSLLLSNNHLSYIEKNVFDDVPRLVFVVLDSNFLQIIPYLGSLPLIHQISVNRNYFAEWQHWTVSPGSEFHIPILEMEYNRLNKLPQIQFITSELSLKGNRISDLSTTMLLYPKAISSLDISFNNIEYLDKLQTMMNLKTLFLEYNRIRSISEFVFTELPSLETINLRGNVIVDASPLRNMPHIEYISLQDNNLHFVAKPAFTNIPNIHTIDLRNNEIIHFIYDSFCLTSLSLLLNHNSLLAMDIYHETNHSKVEFLNVHTNKLETVPILHFPLLKSLYAEYNRITNLQFDVNGHQNLRYVNLCGNQIRNITNFLNLTGLNWLLLCNNYLTLWEDRYLIGSSQLVTLNLSNNRLSILSSFTALPRLQKLDLSGNILHTIDNSTFASTPILTTLNLSKNEISNLAFLASLFSISKLYISHNRLTAINPQDFSNLINLRTLDLSFNFIVEINFTMLNLRSLQTLLISHNQMTRFNLDHLLEQRALVYIDVEENMIKDIFSAVPKQVHMNINNNAIGISNSSLISGSNILACNNNLKEFKQINISPALIGLYLSRNQIASIPNFTFNSASSLWYLELDDNHITYIAPLAFAGLLNIKRLKLERNHLVYLPSGVFSHLQKLKFLRLGENPLRLTMNQAFSGIQGLQGVGLYGIPFSNISIKILQDFKMVEYLDLHENFAFQGFFLSNMTTTPIFEFPNLRTINLSSNELGIHCPVLSMKNLEAVNLSNNSFTSIPKHCLPQNSKAYTLYFSKNKITSITRDSFNKHQQFWFLDLGYNRIVFFELGALQHQTYLTDINLEGNKLVNLDHGSLVFSLRVVMVNLQNNPWSCDCDLVKAVHEFHPESYMYKPVVCEKPLLYVNSNLLDLVASNTFACRLQLCTSPNQTLLSFVGETMIELPCPIVTPNFIYWSVTFRGQQPLSIKDTFPKGVSILPNHALLITDITEDMNGLYTCWSENEFGLTKFTVNMLVEENTGREASSNLSVMLARKWKDTLPCGNKTLAFNTCNIISTSYNVLFSLMLAIQSLRFSQSII